MRAALAPGVLAVAACAATAAAATPVAPARCRPGARTVGGVPQRTFCGPASAVVRTGGKTHRIAVGGECERGRMYLAVNVGTVVLGRTTRPKPTYFGLSVGRTPLGGTPAARDGTYANPALSFTVGGRSFAVLRATVTLGGGRTRGTFRGTVLGGGPVTGSFTC